MLVAPFTSAKLCFFPHHGHRNGIIDVSTALPRQLLTPSASKEQTFSKDASFQKAVCTIGEDRGINVYAVTIADHVGIGLLHFLQGHPAPISSMSVAIIGWTIISILHKWDCLCGGFKVGRWSVGSLQVQLEYLMIDIAIAKA